MAKGKWPTVSKGVFYSGYNKGKSESKSAGTRAPGYVNPGTSKKETAQNRLVKPAKNKNTVRNMQFPAG